MRHRLTLALLSLIPACTTTTAIRGQDVAASLARPTGGDLVLVGEDDSSVRLDPNSEICFHLVNGEQTRWLKGRELYNTEEGVAFAPDPEQPDKRLAIPFQAIARAEVTNFSGAKTAAAVIGSAAVIVVVAALVSSLGRSSSSNKAGKVSGAKAGRQMSRELVSAGGRPRGKISARSVSSGRRAKVSVPRASRAPSAQRARPTTRRWHRSRAGDLLDAPVGNPRAHGSVQLFLPVDEGEPPPPPAAAETAEELAPASSPGAGPEPPAAEPEGLPAGDVALAPQLDDRETAPKNTLYEPRSHVVERRLFNGRERRRSRIRLIGGVDLGTELHAPSGMVDGAHIGVRLDDTMELAGGFRHLLDMKADGARESHVLGYGYLGYHFELDSRRWFALPFGLEVGAGAAAKHYARINLGLRIHPHERLFIGIYPFNPTHLQAREDMDAELASGWSFPSSIEVGFNF